MIVNWTAKSRKYCCKQCEQWSHPRRPRVAHIDYRECRECGGSFTWRIGEVKDYCTDRCARRSHHRDRRHRERAAGVGRAGSITLRELAERDGWQCHLCGRSVPDREFKARPLDATIDHLIPLSAGGEHVPENVALAHFRCNSSRGAKGLAQLRLVA